MSEWVSLLRRPTDLADGPKSEAWFGRIAARLLTGCRVMVADKPHRFTEVEGYYNGSAHADPFAHCDPVQKQGGRWYFHRTGGIYRSGSFKGVDLAFGDDTAFGGFLIRGLEEEGGKYIDGPSLLVDHLLATTGKRDVATLDAAMAERVAWDDEVPLRLEWLEEPVERTVYRAPRVGLSLKRAKPPGEKHLKFIMRHYRYYTEPRKTAKGKPHMVLGLHARGKTPEEIYTLTGCPRATVQRYIKEHEAGMKLTDLKPFFGTDLGTADICQLHGACHARV
jgi:hypothetical protein